MKCCGTGIEFDIFELNMKGEVEIDFLDDLKRFAKAVETADRATISLKRLESKDAYLCRIRVTEG